MVIISKVVLNIDLYLLNHIRYRCSQCSSLQDATRYIQLRKLPPVRTMSPCNIHAHYHAMARFFTSQFNASFLTFNIWSAKSPNSPFHIRQASTWLSGWERGRTLILLPRAQQQRTSMNSVVSFSIRVLAPIMVIMKRKLWTSGQCRERRSVNTTY